MQVKKTTLVAITMLASSMMLSPRADASGFIVVDPAFHVPPVAPVTPTISSPTVTPVRPGRPGVARPVSPVLHGSISTGLSLDKQEISVEIDNHVAKTYIKQTFRNDTDRNLAGTYLFPLPQDATFSSFSLHIDGKAVEGQILAAAEARAQYEQIVRSMIDPGLLEYADYKTVRARIFPIPAHGTKTVELEYTQLVKADGGMFKYKFPLKSAQCEAVDETKIALRLKSKEELRTIWSPSHIISTERKDGGHLAIVSFSDKASAQSEKDFSVYYTVSDKELSASLLAHKKSDEDGYFLMTLNPPFSSAKQVIAKDIVLVADTSGSMAGEKMDQCRKALKFVIDALNPNDRFSLVQFNTDAESFNGELLEATADNKAKARTFIDDLDARGGTNIGEALSTGLTILNSKTDVGRPAYLVLMTDGQPTVGITESAALIDSVKPKRDVRLFDFGVGYDVNTMLLNKLAEGHHGTAQYVEPDESLEVALSQFYNKVKSPVLSDVKLAYNGVEVKDIYPKSVKDIFAGSPVMLLGRYKQGAPATVKLSGKVNGVEKSFDFPMTFAAQETGSQYLPRMWAMRRIGYLTEVAQANNENQEVVDEIVELSKRYGIISAYTSFLVTDPNERLRAGDAVARVPVSRSPRMMFRQQMTPRRMQLMSSDLTTGSGLRAPFLDDLSKSHRLVIGGGGGIGAGNSALPGVSYGKSVHQGRVRGSIVPSGSWSAAAPPPPGSPVSAEPRRIAASVDSNLFSADEEGAARRAKESKNEFARALAAAKPDGERAVQMQKSLSDLKSVDALAMARSDGSVKVIGDKTFYLLDGFWVDSSFEKIKDPKTDDIEFGSKKYFDLVKTESGITQYLGAGQRMIVVYKGRCYKIVAPASNTG